MYILYLCFQLSICLSLSLSTAVHAHCTVCAPHSLASMSCDRHINITACNPQAEVGKRVMDPASGTATVAVDTAKTYDYELRSINEDGAFSKPFVVRIPLQE
jgi:hypothetical protein